MNVNCNSFLSKKRENPILEDHVKKEEFILIEEKKKKKIIKEKIDYSILIVNQICSRILSKKIETLIRDKKEQYTKKLLEVTLAKEKIINKLTVIPNNIKSFTIDKKSNNKLRKDMLNQNESYILLNHNRLTNSKCPTRIISDNLINNSTIITSFKESLKKNEENNNKKNELLDLKLKISEGRNIKIFNESDFSEDKKYLKNEKHKLFIFIQTNYEKVKSFILSKNKKNK